jgi:opacity protein-like surface antigen
MANHLSTGAAPTAAPGPTRIPRLLVILTLVLLSAAVSEPARADALFTIGGGYFAMKGEDGRVEDDVLVNNLDFLVFDLSDFNTGFVSGEFAVGLGRYFEAGVGVGYSKRTVPTVYADYIDSDGSEIDQELRLRTAPVTGIVRFFPTGRYLGVQPYVGGGIAVVLWRYSETGEFVDFRDNSIFRDSFADEGSATGPVFVGGLRFPLGRSFMMGGEFRYTDVETDVDPSLGFSGTRLDLGGYVTQATFTWKF